MRGAITLLAGLALTGVAHAAPPAVTAAAAPASGVAPVRVTLTATGDAASYTCALGDGSTAEGAVVTHVLRRRHVRWRIYRKVAGWDWVLWYPMYFKGGFAIHGYPSVPAYPASHGCVRIPMWIAPPLFGAHAYDTNVVVHL